MSFIAAIVYFFIFTILLRHPYVLVALVLLYVLRDRLPNPAAFIRRQKDFSRLGRAVRINPYDSTARRDLGMVLLDKNRPKEALDNFMAALEKEPDSAEINHFVGLSSLRSGDPARAAGYFKKAIEIEPRLRYGESHLYLGESLLSLGKPEEAMATLKSFLDINNTSIEGLYLYAKALQSLGRSEEAKKAVEEGMRYHKGNPGFRRRRDWRSYVKLKALRSKIS
ncbi:MAG: tetratricopeptide repeat protein [Nitrospirota bacterium]